MFGSLACSSLDETLTVSPDVIAKSAFRLLQPSPDRYETDSYRPWIGTILSASILTSDTTYMNCNALRHAKAAEPLSFGDPTTEHVGIAYGF